ncbi:RsmB/NOP family class I SAM-dependent RNA methyltransferase [Arvimicrobium flavum]|uniref:RsmB/NOP family class I SAM-dependent RNA methyltransferase n=1 Tax=Arvimicrobium flavum TaxID=3393320 RepID=UPI00237BFCEA|nr:RsmB/NOP family class I SAM-dependent RNA methyltransferase [Mesorhizobium shangrilense]
MRLGGRLAAAIEVIDDIERGPRPVADAMKDWGLSHRFAGAGDRAAIGNIVYDALRRKRSSAWLLDADTPRALAFGALLGQADASPAQLNAELEGDRFAPAMLDDTELSTIARQREIVPPDAVRADCSDWCAPLLQEAYGEAWVDEARAMAERPPLDLRVNTLKADEGRVLAELEGTGAVPTALARHGLRIPPIAGLGRHPNVQAEAAFQNGWFEVQDEGSQIAADLAGATPAMQVLDYCAGAGGKTLALAAAMENHGQIFAHDAEKQRLKPIFERLQRAGVRNAQVVSRVGELEKHKEQFDLVVVDAPCTGSGTWRRRPDAKWRLSERQLEVRRAEQSDILDKTSAFVKPGGMLAYITCSIFEAENFGQIDAFLQRTPGWAPVDHVALWNGRFPHAAGRARVDFNRGIRLSPLLTGTDGFYFAGLRRQ